MPWAGKGGLSLSLPFRKRNRYVINEPEPSYQVVYLGNVLTMMAKGETCVEKPLALIWKTHLGRTRPDLPMRLCVAKSGLKAETKLQGLTEYWSHRITYCVAPPAYPRVFCWIYKHEGKKMKPELRCHAVLCRKEAEPAALADRLSQSLASALAEYRREKLSRQNNRLAAQLAGQAAGLPARKAILSTGASNFRPPISRSKSAPKLGMIEEGAEDDEEEEDEEEDEVASLAPSSLSLLHSPSIASDDVASFHSADAVVESFSQGMGDSPRSPDSPHSPQPSTSTSSAQETIKEEEEEPRPPPRLHRMGTPPPTHSSSAAAAEQPSPRLPASASTPSSSSSNGDEESESISDESGYHEEKASLESASDDGICPPPPPPQPQLQLLSVLPDDPDVTVTAF